MPLLVLQRRNEQNKASNVACDLSRIYSSRSCTSPCVFHPIREYTQAIRNARDVPLLHVQYRLGRRVYRWRRPRGPSIPAPTIHCTLAVQVSRADQAASVTPNALQPPADAPAQNRCHAQPRRSGSCSTDATVPPAVAVNMYRHRRYWIKGRRGPRREVGTGWACKRPRPQRPHPTQAIGVQPLPPQPPSTHPLNIH